jgi:hypothetical protein
MSIPCSIGTASAVPANTTVALFVSDGDGSSPMLSPAPARELGSLKISMESLILAQDERWRRA